MKRELEEDDRFTIVNAMRVAANVYRETAKALRGMAESDEGSRRLAKHFDRQVANVLKQAEALEQAESVIIEE